MTLSCSCGDFDKGDFDDWWEVTPLQAPDNARCCECNSPIPEGTSCAGFISYETWTPDDIEDEPPDPEHVLSDEPECSVLSRHWEHLYLEMEIARERWFEDRGYDYDNERFERETGRQYRCERCDDIAASIEPLGFCTIAAGDLIDTHVEFVALQGTDKRARWSRGADGIWTLRIVDREVA